MVKNIDDLKAALLAAKDGSVACDLINKLAKDAHKGNDQAMEVLALYVREGRINHMREHACARLADSVSESRGGYAELFRENLSDPKLRYWSIPGYLRSAGKDAYKELTEIAGDKAIPLEQRSHAIKCLAVFSTQPFDRGLPSDPGFWKKTDLRLAEVRAWARDGFPDGRGYSSPSRDAALDEPVTDLEKTVSRLDGKLAKERKKRQDLAAPTNWLALAAPEDIARIKARWELPSVYREFLTRFSPIGVIIENRRFYNGFFLFGAGELIEGQDGYSYDPAGQQPLETWPGHLIVIASHGGDPFVLDLSKSDGHDAPVATAEHGTGVWKFRRGAGSFLEFLERLAK